MKKFLLLLILLTGGTTFAQIGVDTKVNTLIVTQTSPVWPGCEQNQEMAKECFQEKLTAHLKEHYQYPRDEEGKIIRGEAVVQFIINEEGKVEILSAEGPQPELNEEAVRIISLIPEMQPGQSAGKPVISRFTVPFTF